MALKFRKNCLFCSSCKVFREIYDFPWKIKGIIRYKTCVLCHLAYIKGQEEKVIIEKYLILGVLVIITKI
jgi:hypothetical protein